MAREFAFLRSLLYCHHPGDAGAMDLEPHLQSTSSGFVPKGWKLLCSSGSGSGCQRSSLLREALQTQVTWSQSVSEGGGRGWSGPTQGLRWP